MIKAEIVADSLSTQGDRLTSLLITFPRIILAEVNTHRMLSKNTSSSRAIPFNKMVEAVQNNPFIPIAWQKEHKGMQGSEYIPVEKNIYGVENTWLGARNRAIELAKSLNKQGVTKQLCNRLLEPFMWTTMLITGSKEGWDNFFELRCPQYESPDGKLFKSRKDYQNNSDWEGSNEWNELDWLGCNKGQAEIHMMDLAEKIYDAMNESTPKQLKANEWHIPFTNNIDLSNFNFGMEPQSNRLQKHTRDITKVKISTAMAARTSYTIVGDEKEIDYQKMIEIHDKCKELNHSSVFEHCARAMSDEEYNSYYKGYVPLNGSRDDEKKILGWCRNFKGFIQYRHIIETNKN